MTNFDDDFLDDDEEEKLLEDEQYVGMKKKEFIRLYTKYPYIYAWGKFMRSEDFYIGGQMELAEFENAPQDAIFRGSEGTWETIGEVTDKNTLSNVKSYLPN